MSNTLLHPCSPHDPCPPCAADNAKRLADSQAAFVVLAEGWLEAQDEGDRQLMWKIAGRVSARGLGNCPDDMPPDHFPGLTYARVARMIARRSRQLLDSSRVCEACRERWPRFGQEVCDWCADLCNVCGERPVEAAIGWGRKTGYALELCPLCCQGAEDDADVAS